jgi:organic radical activating enzyme
MINTVKQIIPAFQPKSMPLLPGTPSLRVAEFYCDTIQGENMVGYPAAFLRLQHCTLNCQYCDSTEVWRTGEAYSYDELFKLMDEADLPRKLYEGQHLVITGGSPLLQEAALIGFLEEFLREYEFKPFIEIENECTIMPTETEYVNLWNNSPKLASSGIYVGARYKPDILLMLSGLQNSWFKFVISHPQQWMEIWEYFVRPGLIQKKQIVLMPEGSTLSELEKTRPVTLKMAIDNSVRYTDRLHIQLWNKKIGV